MTEAAPSPAVRAMIHAATALVANAWQASDAWREDFALLARVLPAVPHGGAWLDLRLACAEIVAARTAGDTDRWRRASDGLRFAVERYHRRAMIHFWAQMPEARADHAG